MSKEKKNLHNQSLDELNASASQLAEHLFKLKMQHATGQLANTASLKLTRKELARIKTIVSLKNAVSTAKATAARK